MEDSVAGVDVREETVPQTLALGGAFDEASDVHHVQERRDFAGSTRDDCLDGKEMATGDQGSIRSIVHASVDRKEGVAVTTSCI